MPSALKLLSYENYRTGDDIERVLGEGFLAQVFSVGLGDDKFRRSTNRKISPVQSYRRNTRLDGTGKRGNFDIDLVGAALGFASGPDNSCPGATDFCSSGCYSINAEQSKTSIGIRMRDNLDNWQEASPESKTATLITQLLDYNERCIRRDVPQKDRIFRFNWAGDIADQETAEAIVGAMEVLDRLVEDEDTDFALKAAVYTRTYAEDLNVIPTLVGTPNLNVYISVDPDNWCRAVEVYDEYHDQISLSFLGTDYDMGINLAHAFAQTSRHEFDLDRFPVAELAQDGSMPYSYPRIIVCPEELPYGKVNKKTGDQKYLGLNKPIRSERIAEEEAAKAEGREYDPHNVRLMGACAVCQACYGPNPKHVIFSDQKVIRSMRKNHPTLLSDEHGVPVTLRKRRGGAVLASEEVQSMSVQVQPEQLF